MDKARATFRKLHKAVFIIDKIAEHTLQEKTSMGFSQFLIMIGIRRNQDVSQLGIAKFLGLTPAAVSRQIECMQKKGLVQREEKKENRREHVLSLTKKGNAQFKRASVALKGRFRRIYSSMGQGEIDALEKGLEKLLYALSKESGFSFESEIKGGKDG
jgi:DNA-binding MarR family transcriptional regulator